MYGPENLRYRTMSKQKQSHRPFGSYVQPILAQDNSLFTHRQYEGWVGIRQNNFNGDPNVKRNGSVLSA